MKLVVVTRQARQDILNAAEYYESQVEGLGSEFANRVDESLRRIEINPEMYQKAYKNFRRASIQKFKNYGIWYTVLDDQSIVVACLSSRMHPTSTSEILSGIRPIGRP